VAQQLGVGDGRAADPHVAFGQRAEGHRRVDVERGVLVGQLEERLALEGAHVGDADPEAGEALHDSPEPGDPGVAIAVRRGADVEHEDAPLGLRPLVDGVEAGVVGIDALDGEVELEPAQAQVVQRLAGHPHEVWIVGVEGAERDRPAQARADPGQPLVQRARHPRLVGVAEETEAVDAPGGEGLRHRLGVERVGVQPVLAREVPLDRLGERRRMQMDVDVDASGRHAWRLHEASAILAEIAGPRPRETPRGQPCASG